VVPQFLGLDYGAVDLIFQCLVTFQKLFFHGAFGWMALIIRVFRDLKMILI
jgi:hypothetical protein